MKIPPDIKKFRFAILPPTICIFSGSMLGILFSLCLLLGVRLNGRELAVVVVVMALFSVGYSWLMALIFPDGFSSAGVYGHSFWGRRRFMTWHDLVRVRPFWFFNMKYLRIYAPDGKTIWLPLFQSQGPEFRAEIRKFAPPDSPLLKYL